MLVLRSQVASITRSEAPFESYARRAAKLAPAWEHEHPVEGQAGLIAVVDSLVPVDAGLNLAALTDPQRSREYSVPGLHDGEGHPITERLGHAGFKLELVPAMPHHACDRLGNGQTVEKEVAAAVARCSGDDALQVPRRRERES